MFLPHPGRAGTAVLARAERSRWGRPAGEFPAASCFSLRNWIVPPIILLTTALAHASDCIPIYAASQHVGQIACVTGKVLRVKVGARGVHFLNFCEDQMACPFTVVVFSHDLKDVGDVRRLAGRLIEIKGAVKLYDGRAEMVLNRISQITGGAMLIPPLPKDYDVEKRGHYSAGHLTSKKLKATKPTPNPTATYGYDVEGAEPPE
jgi:hypothetical protein